jgi:hypothetical protein
MMKKICISFFVLTIRNFSLLTIDFPLRGLIVRTTIFHLILSKKKIEKEGLINWFWNRGGHMAYRHARYGSSTPHQSCRPRRQRRDLLTRGRVRRVRHECSLMSNAVSV